MVELKTPIKGLTIISSCGCNLNCKYCQIAMNKTPKAEELQLNTIQALKDGSFLINILNVLARIKASPAQIKQIDLWGQEPTLTLEHFTNHLSDWLNAFPNWEKTFFSTNGMAHGDKILKFILTLDSLLTKPFQLGLQISYDGDVGNDQERGADTVTIEQTAYNLIKELNNYTLNYLTINFHLHGVTSMELIKKLDDTEKIFNYFNDTTSIADILSKLNRNKSVNIIKFVTFTFENPLTLSADDGILLDNFYKKCLKIPTHNFVFPQTGQSIIGLAQFIEKFNGTIENFPLIENKKQLLDMLAEPTSSQRRKELIQFLSQQCFCAMLYGELKIMYDGTCILCQNLLSNSHDEEPIPIDGTIKTGAIRSFQQHDFYFNPLTLDDDTLSRIFILFEHGKNDSFVFMYTNTVNLMLRLLAVRQIDSSYEDLNKLLEHALYLTVINTCPYNHYIETGSLYGKTVGLIRAYCNGLLDTCLNILNKIHHQSCRQENCNV